MAFDDDPRLLPHDLGSLPHEDRERAREQFRHMEGEPGFRRAMERLGELTRRAAIPVIVVLPDTRGTPWSLVAAGAEQGSELLVMGPYLATWPPILPSTA